MKYSDRITLFHKGLKHRFYPGVRPGGQKNIFFLAAQKSGCFLVKRSDLRIGRQKIRRNLIFKNFDDVFVKTDNVFVLIQSQIRQS